MPRLKTTGKKIKKLNTIIDPEDGAKVITELVGKDGDPRWGKFLAYHLFGATAFRAALNAGYPRSFAKSGVYKWLEKPETRAQIEGILGNLPQRYRDICRLRLVDVAEVEGALLEKLKSEPEKLLRNPAIVRQIKETAGAIPREQGPQVQNIDIQSLQVLVAKAIPDLVQPRVIDAKVIGEENVRHKNGKDE